MWHSDAGDLSFDICRPLPEIVLAFKANASNCRYDCRASKLGLDWYQYSVSGIGRYQRYRSIPAVSVLPILKPIPPTPDGCVMKDDSAQTENEATPRRLWAVGMTSWRIGLDRSGTLDYYRPPSNEAARRTAVFADRIRSSSHCVVSV